MDTGIFGLHSDYDNSQQILLPIPWEVTTSYGSGTSIGPAEILNASPQLDLFDWELKDISQHGIHMLKENPEVIAANKEFKTKAQVIISHYDRTGGLSSIDATHEINLASEKLNKYVYEESRRILEANKLLGIVGGDHSSPYGAIKALSEKHMNYGILHIDAHADLRHSYQGFEHSHASIMYNVLQLPNPPKNLVQVGIRDFCEEEFVRIHDLPNINCFFDRQTKQNLFKGLSWGQLAEDIIQRLPQHVYISFDIDGLSPEYCPDTGTPVPGGLSFDQAIHLLTTLGKSGRKIIGFDLCEVAPSKDKNNEYNGNIGARILFQLCGWSLKTNGYS